MDANYYKKYEPIFGAWTIKRKLGEGNFGSVYEIEREDFGTTYHAALKAITIPKNQAELDSILDDGMDITSAEQYLEQFVEKIVSEFVLMSKLKGNSHIVSYEDHQVIKHKDGIGWDILIRMELLTPMMTYVKSTSITKRDVIKLGIDMCRALELCQKYNIIHRDIKPENIFISDSGDFKLGDFGIAKEVEKTQSGLTKTGTQTYMAPEVYKGQPYGSSVDMYSLGIVLYRLLNHNRAPFMPQYPNPISYKDRERALVSRMSGHKFPLPSNVSGGRLAEIAMKACSYKPEDRYSSPTQMREDLEAILYTEGEGILMFSTGDNIEIKSVEYISGSGKSSGKVDITDDATEIIDEATEILLDNEDEQDGKRKTKQKKNGKFKTVSVLAFLLIALASISFLFLNRESKDGPTTLVSNVQELSEPIEFRIKEPVLSDSDYEIISKRAESYGKRYYINKDLNTMVLSKADLGTTEQEILATIHMITGRGVLSISNFDCSSINTLNNADLQSAKYEYDEKAGESRLVIETTNAGKGKLQALSNEIINSDNKTISLSVDGNIRLSTEISNELAEGRIIITEKEGQSKNMIAGLLDAVSMTVHAEDIKLSSNYMKLIVSFVNDGMLTATYEIYIDEKYGLITPEPEVTPEPDVIEENEEITEEEPTQAPQKQQTTQKNTTQQKTSTQQKSTQQSNTQQKPTQQQPVQQAPAQQPVQQQPAQQAPAQQAPVQQQPVQQAPSSNAGMPEVYVDFD